LSDDSKWLLYGMGILCNHTAMITMVLKQYPIMSGFGEDAAKTTDERQSVCGSSKEGRKSLANQGRELDVYAVFSIKKTLKILNYPKKKRHLIKK
jgi:hypothetical protein